MILRIAAAILSLPMLPFFQHNDLTHDYFLPASSHIADESKPPGHRGSGRRELIGNPDKEAVG